MLMMNKILLFTSLSLLLGNPLFAQSPQGDKVYKKSDETYVQRMDRYSFKDNYRAVSLKAVLEEGLRKNHQQKIRPINKELLDLGWRDSYSEFWFPTVNLVLSSGVQRLDHLRIGKNNTKRSKSPAGTLGLEIGDYTLFNWGKDYASFLNKKRIYQRSKQHLREAKRELKLDLMVQYFDLITRKQLLKIAKYKLRQASFVYRHSREKITLKKISKQDYYQTRGEYLKAQEEYHQAKIILQLSDEKMAELLGDPAGTRYNTKELLRFIKIKVSITEAETLSLQANPTILDTKTELEVAKKEYLIVKKENLPLPKISINLGAYTHTYDDDRNQTRYYTHDDSSNLEITATVNATWSLVGVGGFFNKRKTATSFVTKNLKQRLLASQKHRTHSNIASVYKKILNHEKMMTILQSSTSNLRKTYDLVLENYLKRKTSFINYKSALADLIAALGLFENNKFDHFKNKIELAKLMGVEDFAGENFEKLAVWEKAE